MRDTTQTLCQSSLSWHSISFGLKVSLIPGLTVSLGLPYRGRDRETETGERPGREKPGIACLHRGVWGSKSLEVFECDRWPVTRAERALRMKRIRMEGACE